MKKIFLSGSILLLTACGVTSNAVISDQSLAKKAAFALNTTADQVSISQRSGNIDSVEFVATVKGKAHQCYITTVAGVISSDAVCAGTGGGGNAQNCNALLKAAGRC